MSTDDGHFEPRSGSLNTILEVEHLRTIDDMLGIFFPIGSYVKTTVCSLVAAILYGGQGHWTQF
jgi:hypothetical protein